MKKHRILGDDKIPCQGKVIIHHLDYARRLLSDLPFRENVQLSAAEEQAQNIEVIIVEVASLCTGYQYWAQLYDYLQESGVSVSEEFCYRKMYLDRIMDVNPVEANRN